MKRVLVIDDSPEVRAVVVELIQKMELEALEADGGKAGLAKATDARPDVILLDVQMGDINGFEVLKQIKSNPLISQTPVVMVTAEVDVDDRVKGLELGADDYLCKPFNSKELTARVNACLRRAPAEQKGESVHTVGNLKVDGNTFEVTVADQPVHLTPREFELIFYFLKNPDQIVNRKKLLSDLWPGTVVGERTVDTHITNLRQKLKGASHTVETSHGVGYILKKN